MTRKPASRIAKTARRTTARARPSKVKKSASVKKSDAVDSLIAASAQALALPIDRAWLGGVKFHLRLIFTHAALVDEFPLADETEPAPVFHA